MARPLAEQSGRVCVWTPTDYAVVARDDRSGLAVLCLEREFFRSLVWHFQGARDGQRVQLVATEGTVGGLRWWFACPDCDRRCATLYRPRTRALYACRRCAGVSYESQREPDRDRLYRRASKLYARVSVEGPEGRRQKRRWVRRRTYQRTMAEARYYDAVSLGLGLRRLLQRAD